MVVLLELSVVVVIDLVDVVDVVDTGLVVVERSRNLSITVKFSSRDKSEVSKVVVVVVVVVVVAVEDVVVVEVVVDDENESSSYNSLLKLTKFLCLNLSHDLIFRVAYLGFGTKGF